MENAKSGSGSLFKVVNKILWLTIICVILYVENKTMMQQDHIHIENLIKATPVYVTCQLCGFLPHFYDSWSHHQVAVILSFFKLVGQSFDIRNMQNILSDTSLRP